MWILCAQEDPLDLIEARDMRRYEIMEINGGEVRPRPPVSSITPSQTSSWCRHAGPPLQRHVQARGPQVVVTLNCHASLQASRAATLGNTGCHLAARNSRAHQPRATAAAPSSGAQQRRSAAAAAPQEAEK